MHVYNLEIINIVLSFALYQDSRMWNNEESFLLDVVLDIKDFVALTFCKTINYNYNCSPGGITEETAIRDGCRFFYFAGGESQAGI